MTDLGAQNAFTQAIAVAGQQVTFQRLSGNPSNPTISPGGTGATVNAVVRDANPDSRAVSAGGYSASQIGGISQDDRMILVMAADLAAADFPLPLRKGDQVVIVATGDVLSLTRVDAAKRIFAGCIECTGTGVA